MNLIGGRRSRDPHSHAQGPYKINKLEDMMCVEKEDRMKREKKM